MTDTVWIIRGKTTDGTATEWQFSDGPPGKRGYSSDYPDLAEGLTEHKDVNLNTRYADFTADEEAIFRDFKLRRGF